MNHVFGGYVVTFIDTDQTVTVENTKTGVTTCKMGPKLMFSHSEWGISASNLRLSNVDPVRQSGPQPLRG